MRTFALIPLIALTLVGCGLFSIEPEEIDIAEGDEVGAEDVGDTTGDATGDESGTGGESSTDGSDTTTTDPTTGDSADSSSDSPPDTSGDSTGTDTGSACELSGDEPVCLACVMDTCCEELLACELDPDCACLLGCIENEGTLEACQAECPALGDPLAALTSCADSNCVVECG